MRRRALRSEELFENHSSSRTVKVSDTGMAFNFKHCGFVLSLVFLLMFFCEFLVYYIVLWQCRYPTLQSTAKDPLHAMFLADTHLLGSRNGHWFDKLRREWQMHRSFQTAQTYFRPEATFFLGDLFDEGKWCGWEEFERYVQRFKSLFPVAGDQELFVVAGNHDIGFHYAVTPYLNHRFQKAFQVQPIDKVDVKGNSFVLVNSMAMEGDGCFLCSEAKDNLRDVQMEMECLKDKDNCPLSFMDDNMEAKDFVPPILLLHFPLFRESDVECNEPDEASPVEKQIRFREKWDCLSNESTELLFKTLKPRMAFSGHTHNGCRTKHPNGVEEVTVSSFSWRNRNNPAFILARITPDEIAIEKCFLPEEDTVIHTYTIGIIMIVVYIIVSRRKFTRRF